ncbi:MAG TPA: type II secretion system F family protein [Gemmataceae bacterium]|jgi:tight adherence protein C|nr:type II secretion system F family protein [Gemmataceae bacterium]
MPGGILLTLVAFASAGSLIVLICMFIPGRNQRVQGRIQTLISSKASQQETVAVVTRAILPRIGSPLVPSNKKAQKELKTRLVHAGFYGLHSLYLFLGVKMLFMAVPVIVGLVATSLGLVPYMNGVLYGLLGSCIGMLLPNFWLDSQKKKRQILLRRGLPDALDMVGVCLNGGLSLQGAFQRVTNELAMAHPALGKEFTINQREIQLGRSTGEAMKHFAERCDLEEISSLASVILQSERLGASAVQALRIHAETLRLKRLQLAEEKAHTAGTKIVFPTILCIFPSILIVVIGPAAIQIADLFSNMK